MNLRTLGERLLRALKWLVGGRSVAVGGALTSKEQAAASTLAASTQCGSGALPAILRSQTYSRAAIALKVAEEGRRKR